MSPGSKSLVSQQPWGSITVVRTRPSVTKAHSAAVAFRFLQLEFEGGELLARGYGIGNVILEAVVTAFGTDGKRLRKHRTPLWCTLPLRSCINLEKEVALPYQRVLRHGKRKISSGKPLNNDAVRRAIHRPLT